MVLPCRMQAATTQTRLRIPLSFPRQLHPERIPLGKSKRNRTHALDQMKNPTIGNVAILNRSLRAMA